MDGGELNDGWIGRSKMYGVPGRCPSVTDFEIRELRTQIPEWEIVNRESIARLEQIYRFKNFAESLAFTVKVGNLAESEGHHPAILTEWGRTIVKRV